MNGLKYIWKIVLYTFEHLKRRLEIRMLLIIKILLIINIYIYMVKAYGYKQQIINELNNIDNNTNNFYNYKGLSSKV